MVITHLGCRCIQARILGGTFDGQVRLIPRIALTSTDGDLPFIVSRRSSPSVYASP
jgi:hypothetical protein